MRSAEPRESHDASARSQRTVYYAAAAWLAWLPLTVPMVLAVFAAHPSAVSLALSLAGLIVFVVIYSWTAFRNARDIIGIVPSTEPQSEVTLWLPIILMLALSLVLTETYGVALGGLFIFTCASAAGRLSAAKAAGLLATVALMTLFFGWRTHLPLSASLSAVLWMGFAGITTITMVWAIRSSRHMREERAEMARLAAITEERLRIARDLHDLLGHSLSAIALKAELARKLGNVEPERAAGEIADIERIARTSLQDVREAVSGYRQPTLASEVSGATELLAAAGIACDREGDVPAALPSAIEVALAWAVREGVTNTIRHSHARHCAIKIRQMPGGVCLEIRDDGSGSVPSPERRQAMAGAEGSGNGLRGLAERVASLGGQMECGPAQGGGFRLSIRLPVESGARLSSPVAQAVALPQRTPAAEPDGLASTGAE